MLSKTKAPDADEKETFYEQTQCGPGEAIVLEYLSDQEDSGNTLPDNHSNHIAIRNRFRSCLLDVQENRSHHHLTSLANLTRLLWQECEDSTPKAHHDSLTAPSCRSAVRKLSYWPDGRHLEQFTGEYWWALGHHQKCSPLRPKQSCWLRFVGRPWDLADSRNLKMDRGA